MAKSEVTVRVEGLEGVKALLADQAYRIRALESVLADRERELLDLKGPCSNPPCPLHYAHAGPCAPEKRG